MNAQTTRSRLTRMALYVFWGFFGLGLFGYWYVGITSMTGKPPRPDLDLDQLLIDAKAPLAVEVIRISKNFDPKDSELERLDNIVYPGDPNAAILSQPFAIGDMADAFTAMAVCKLQEQGLLDFDHSVTEYLPDLSPAFDQVHVAALLTHTSGITADMFAPPSSALVPGKQSVRAALNYRILERMIDSLTRLPFHQYIQSTLVGPLNMQQTRWDQETSGWMSSAHDLQIFEESLNSNRVIGLKALLRAFTVPKLEDGSYANFNFGWEVKDCGGLRMERISAEHGGFNGTFMRFPEKNFAAIMLYAGPKSEFDTHALSEKLARIYLSREMRFPDR